MRILETARVPLTILGLSLVAYRFAHGTQATAAQKSQRSKPGTQATYFVEHPDHIQLGLANRGRWATLINPYAKDAHRIAEGSKLFIAYNCLDCHGADGSGAMGPSLQDGRWHFGGTAGEIFQSIYEGRPDGMPSWGGRISDRDVWRLVAYVESLSKGHDVTTENFTGKTVTRTGH